MSFADERKSIENRFSTEWTATPIAFDNVPFDPPSNADWVRLSIQNGESGYRSLDGGLRHSGIISVQIFIPINNATKTSRIYADLVSDIFSDQTFDDIVTEVSSISIIDDDAAWLQTNVTTPYYRDAEKIVVPVPVFEPLYVLLNSVKLAINVDDPEIIMSGDVDVITPTRLEISGIISCTFNYVVGIAIYVDGVAIGIGTRSNFCHDDCAILSYNGSGISSGASRMNPLGFNIATDVLGVGIHTIEIGIIGKWIGNSHTIYVGDVAANNIPSSSTLLVKEFRAITGGGSIVERDFSRLNVFLPTATPYTTPELVADIPTKIFVPGALKTVKDFTIDTENARWFFDKPGATGKYFIVQLSNTIITSVSNKTISIELYQNGVRVDGVGASRFMSGGADEGNLNLVGVIQLDHLDYIEGYVTITAAGTITFKRFALTINEMVGAI